MSRPAVDASNRLQEGGARAHAGVDTKQRAQVSAISPPRPEPIPTTAGVDSKGPLGAWTRACIAGPVRALRYLVTLLAWRPVLALFGPLTASGSAWLPDGPCIVVADHHSHADTIALRLALAKAGRHRVVAAAAADYWFRSPARGVVGVVAAGAFPFPRHGDIGLARAAGLLERGFDVILFPQGSREDKAEAWRPGVGRLAAATGATVVPARIEGTAQLLPAHTARPRRHPVHVAFGDPVIAGRGEDPGAITERAHRAAQQARTGPEPRASWTQRLSHHLRTNAARRGAVMLFLWAFAEASVWPLIPDLALAGMVLAVPRKAPRFLAVTVVGSTLGGLAALAAGSLGATWPLPVTTPRMLTHAATAIADHGAAGVLAQPGSGIPYKVFVRAAIDQGVDWSGWAGWTVVARGARMALTTLGAWLVGMALWHLVPSRWRARAHSALVLGALGAFLPLWALVVASWR